jgi:flavin reductase (DIM6/NTAB) family NADH-FMN oxidoreductase RutF
MRKRLVEPATVLYPVPAVMVTCGDFAGEKNIITLAWVGTICSVPPMVGISVRPERFSHPMLKAAGEFVVNLPTSGMAKMTDYCGVASGRDGDKFAATGLTPAPASIVRAPLIAECPVNLECQVKEVKPLGSHDLFLAEIVAVQIDEDALNEASRLDLNKAQPLVYGDGKYWALGEYIDSHGFSARKQR